MGLFLLFVLSLHQAALHQNNQRTRLQRIDRSGVSRVSGAQAIVTRSIHPRNPSRARMKSRQRESYIFVVSIQQNEKVFVSQLSAAFIAFIKSLAREKHSEAASSSVAPLVLGHFGAAGIQPQHVFYVCSLDGAPLKKMPPAEDRMPLAQINHALNEREQVPI